MVLLSRRECLTSAGIGVASVAAASMCAKRAIASPNLLAVALPRPAPTVVVPAGYFLMGSTSLEVQNLASNYGYDASWLDGELPQRSVFVAAFEIQVYPVTNRDYALFCAATGYPPRLHWPGGAPTRDMFLHPVTHVNRADAQAYAAWIGMRLPTEAEWEKAARGPDGFDYGLGMRLSEPTAALYNWRKNPGAEVTLVGVAETLERYRPNRYGVFHASGNAREWTQSSFRHYNAAHPYREDDRNHDEGGGLRVTRGGSWYSASAVRLQLAYREEFQPELASDDLGFRVAAVLGAGGGAAVQPSR
jgi:formylglycine-generating enzyme required for sulfatase activity